MTAGYLAGKLSGKTWEEAIRERLFLPLGMTRTGFSVATMQQDPDHALPYKENEKGDGVELIPYRNIDLIGPAGSVNSSVNEMTRWLLLNLEDGKAGGRQLVQPATLADLRAPHMTLPQQPPPETKLAAAGLRHGLGVEVYRGHKLVEHTGGIDGFSTLVAFFPDDGVGLVAFTNAGSGLVNPVSRELADRLLGLEKIDWLADALKRMEARKAVGEEAEKKVDTLRVKGRKPSHPIGDYAGVYDHPGYGRLEIKTAAVAAKKARTQPRWSARINEIDTPLEHWHYDIWNGAKAPGGDATFEGTKFRFATSFEGEIAAVAVPPSRCTAKPIVFAEAARSQARGSRLPAAFRRWLRGPYRPEGQGRPGGQPAHPLPGRPAAFHPGARDLRPLRASKASRATASASALDAAGKPTKIVFYQPEGVFESKRGRLVEIERGRQAPERVDLRL